MAVITIIAHIEETDCSFEIDSETEAAKATITLYRLEENGCKTDVLTSS
jgi:hypothetical protein